MKIKTVKHGAMVVISVVLLTGITSAGFSSAGAAASSGIETDNSTPATLKASPMEFLKKAVRISTGTKTANIIKINPKDPRISFEVNLPGTMLNKTEDFEKMVKAKGAKAAINANFFSAYTEIKDPIGHVMVDGKLIYGQSGITSVGITKSKDILFGMPGIFTRMFADGKKNQ